MMPRSLHLVGYFWIYAHFLKCSNFKFRWIFATDERRILSGQTFHMMSCGSPLIRVSFVTTDQWASTKHHMGRFCPDTILRSSVANIQRKFENDCISRNRHRIKITQTNLLILVSFSSAEDALSNDVKKHTFSSQGTENLPFRFFLGHVVYIQKGLPCIKKTETNGTTNKIIKISAETFYEEMCTKSNVSMTSE